MQAQLHWNASAIGSHASLNYFGTPLRWCATAYQSMDECATMDTWGALNSQPTGVLTVRSYRRRRCQGRCTSFSLL